MQPSATRQRGRNTGFTEFVDAVRTATSASATGPPASEDLVSGRSRRAGGLPAGRCATRALSRLNAKAFTELFHLALRDKDSSVQKAAVHGQLKAREPRYAEEGAVLLDHGLESVRRVAATGLHECGWPRGRPARPRWASSSSSGEPQAEPPAARIR